MKSLLIVVSACFAAPAWGQPAAPAPAPAGSVAPGPAAELGPTVAPGAPASAAAPGASAAPGAPAAAGAADAAKPRPEYPREVGAVETATGPCSDLVHKPWFEQFTCRPHDTSGTYWMPNGANAAGDGVDTMFYAVLALSIFFFVAITIAVVYFVIKYRGRPGHRAEPSPAHNDTLEITWTVIPTIIVVFLFYYGWRGYIHMATPPVKAVEIQVVAQKWAWSFIHPNGVTDSNLHVPSGTPVRMVMTSRDVLHSFFVPALRTKMDVVPRRYTYVWFEATKPNTYRLYCTEFCGRDHSQMKVKVVVHKPGDYERYLAEKAEADMTRPPVEIGAELYEKKGCVSCHTLDGTPRVGPSFKDSFGSTITLANGASQVVDDNYIRESLMSPLAKARPGFPPSMPSFEGQLKDRQILGLIEFIKAQNPAAKSTEPAPAPEAPGK